MATEFTSSGEVGSNRSTVGYVVAGVVSNPLYVWRLFRFGATELVDGFFANGSLVAEAGPVRSPFPETVPDEVANDHAAIIDIAFVMAINIGHGATARQLHARGAQVNEKAPGYQLTRNGAARGRLARRPGLVEWLLSVGADSRIRERPADSDAIGWANQHGRPELAARLANHTHPAV